MITDWRGRGLAGAATALVAGGFASRQLTEIQIDREPTHITSARGDDNLGAMTTGSRTVQYDGDEIALVRHTPTTADFGRPASA